MKADPERMANDLSRELSALRAAPDPVPEATERAVIEAFRLRQARPGVSGWLLAAAAAVILAIGAAVWFQSRPAESFEVVESAAGSATGQTTAFYVLDPLAPGILDGRGRLVRLTLPPGEGFVGLPRPLEARDGDVQAEILLGDDGVPHAVRFVY